MSTFEQARQTAEISVPSARRERPGGAIASFSAALGTRVASHMSSLRARADDVDLALARQSEAGWATLETEIARSRRHERPFVLIAIPAGDGAQRVETSRIVQACTRLSDFAWLDGDTVYVLLPESRAAQASAFLGRLGRNGDATLTRASVVAFPDDAITLTGMVDALSMGRTTGGLAA